MYQEGVNMSRALDYPARQWSDLQSELEQYRTEEEILYLTAQAVGETTDPQKLLDFLVERIGRRFGTRPRTPRGVGFHRHPVFVETGRRSTR